MVEVYFLHQIKHNKTTDVWDKGIVVKNTGETSKENEDATFQAFHAYLSAYAYGHDVNCDYVCVEVTDTKNTRLDWKIWDERTEPEPETEPESKLEPEPEEET